MCTSICFCPILPSTIAEDGSKPRWLDKSPAAAAVHEHHFTATTSPHKLFPNDPQAAQASPLHISSGESTNPSIATTASSAPNSSSSTSCLPSSLTSLNEQLTTSSTSPSSCSTALCARFNSESELGLTTLTHVAKLSASMLPTAADFTGGGSSNDGEVDGDGDGDANVNGDSGGNSGNIGNSGTSVCSGSDSNSGNGGGVVIVVEGACCRLDDSNDQLATEQSCRQIDHLLLASEDVDWTSLSLNREQMSVNEPTEAPLQSVDADGDLLGQPIRNQLVLPVSVAPFDNFSTPSTSCPATTFLSPPPVSCLAVDKSRQSAFYQLTSNMLPMGGLTLTLPTGLSVPELAYTDVEEQLLCGKQITSGDPMTVDEEGSYLHSSSSSSSSSSCSSSSSVSLSSVGGASRPSCLQKDPHYFMDCISDKGSVGNHRGRTPGVNADCLDAELMLPHGIEKFEGTTGTAITPLEQVFVLPSRQISYPTATSIVAGTAITTTALEAVERMSVDARAASSDGFIFLNESSTRHSDLLTSEYLHMAEPPRPLDSGLLGTSLLAGLPFDICAVGNSGGTARNTGSHCLCAKQTSGSSEVVEEIREEEDEDEDGEEEDTEEVDEEETEVYNENFLSRITEAQCLADSTLSSDTTSHDSKFAHSIANANSDKGVSVTMLTNANSRLLTEKAVVRNLNTTARSESVTGSSDNLELDLLCLAGGPDSKMEIEPAAANHQLGWRQIGDNFHQQHHQDFQHQPQAQRHMDISTKQCAMPNLAETNTFCRPDEPSEVAYVRNSISADVPSRDEWRTTVFQGNRPCLDNGLREAINWLLLHNHSHRRRSSHRFEQMSSDLTISSLSSTACNLAAVQAAWTTVWRGGEFPNPAGVSLRLDTRTQPAHRWRLVLADLWSCVLLRRVVVFAWATLGRLLSPGPRPQNPVDSRIRLGTSTLRDSVENFAQSPIHSSPNPPLPQSDVDNITKVNTTSLLSNTSYIDSSPKGPVLSISSLAESGISTLAPIPSPSFSRTLPSSFIPSSSSTSSSSSASNSSYSSLPLSTTSTLASSFASTQCRSPMAYSVSVRSEAHSQPTQAPHQSDVPFSGSSVLSGRHSLDIELEGDEPFLLPDDFIWIAQHRFTTCIPVLLANCLVRPSLPLPSENDLHTGTSQSETNTKGCIDLNFASLSSSSLSVTNTFPLVSSQCISSNPDSYDTITETNAPSKDSLTSNDGLICNSSSRFTYGDNRPANDCRAQCSVCFRVPPDNSVFISLSRVSEMLAGLPRLDYGFNIGTGLELETSCPAYPILQYLDAYICQLASFLAHQPVLLGTFMLLKLTDPTPTIGQEPEEERANSCEGERTQSKRFQRMSRLHAHFTNVFGDAANLVARQSGRQRKRPSLGHMEERILGKKEQKEEDLGSSPGTLDSEESVATTFEEALAAAESRRVMLQEFLTWGRQFDTAWAAFLRDTRLAGDSQTRPGEGGINQDSDLRWLVPLLEEAHHELHLD